MKTKSIKILAIIFAFTFVIGNAVFAKETYVKYYNSDKLVYKYGSVYQEAFYDYGTPIPFDNARITAISRGSKNNYASIRYADYGSNEFDRLRKETSNSKEAIVDYLSGEDYLQPGSYAYSTGTVELDLIVN